MPGSCQIPAPPKPVESGASGHSAFKPQIQLMLANFLRDSTPQAVFMTSIFPARWHGSDYLGQGWFGTSHESNVAGCIRHSLKWIDYECRRRNLYLRVLGRERQGQTWLMIARGPESRLRFRHIRRESHHLPRRIVMLSIERLRRSPSRTAPRRAAFRFLDGLRHAGRRSS
jgi:hypothetical protein